MECSYWSKLLLLSLFSFLIGSVFSQDIGDILLTDSIACDTFPPPRNLDGMTQDDAAHLWWEVPLMLDTIISNDSVFVIPINLLGYNIFRDSEYLDYVEYDGNDTTFYWDLTLIWPGCYDYYTTALYNMDPCGSPGDTSESEETEVKEICIEYMSVYLPFYENWETGSFGPNLWTAGDNWSVSANQGNPDPSATFNGSGYDSLYGERLSSYAHDCILNPGTYDPYIDGDIYLEFDIKLNDLDTCGIDKMKIQFTDSVEYQTITEFSDTFGSFPWEHHKINITSLVMGKMIKIAFLVEGEGGSIININNWYIDNIALYRQCHPPRDLHWIEAGEVMSWSPPLPHTSKGFTGYNIFSEYNLIEFTTDTFYIFDPTVMSGPIYVGAVYEDCLPVSNSIWGNVGIEDQAPAEINLFPNPANNQITIQADEEIDQISIIDPNGKSLYQQLSSNTKELINVSGFANGFYIAEIMIDGNNIRKKFIIHNP